jgi:hypothetical protein
MKNIESLDKVFDVKRKLNEALGVLNSVSKSTVSYLNDSLEAEVSELAVGEVLSSSKFLFDNVNDIGYGSFTDMSGVISSIEESEPGIINLTVNGLDYKAYSLDIMSKCINTYNYIVSQYTNGDSSKVGFITPRLSVSQYDYLVDPKSSLAFSVNGVTGVLSGDFNSSTGVDSGLSKHLSTFSASKSLIASSSMQSGTVTLEEFTVSKGAGTFLYTGNGTAQDIVTGIPSVDFTVSGNGSGFWFDRTVNQVKDDEGVAQESGECLVNISKVHIKSISASYGNYILDGLRGKTKVVKTDGTDAEFTTGYITSLNLDGFTLSSDVVVNGSAVTYVVHQELYTHVKWGTTSSGKFYVEAFNPVTKSTIIFYVGDGSTDYTIPHSLGSVLGLQIHKPLSLADNWQTTSSYFDRMNLDTNAPDYSDQTTYPFSSDNFNIRVGTNNDNWNLLDGEYIVYGKSKSKVWNIVQYTGTGVAGNFVETLDSDGVARKPSRITFKATSSASDWMYVDNKRPIGGVNSTSLLFLNLSNGAITTASVSVDLTGTGFTVGVESGQLNGLGIQYIALVEFDTNADGGDSYFDLPTDDTNLNLTDATLTYTDGKDQQGFLLSTKNILTESIEFSTAPDGFVYVYRDLLGNYGFDVVESKFDTDIGYYVGETSAKSYIAKVMVTKGTPQYIDESWEPNKTFVGELVSDGNIETVGEFIGKNACTAWCTLDGVYNPPIILDSYNVKAVIRLSTGHYRIYPKHGTVGAVALASAQTEVSSSQTIHVQITSDTYFDVYTRSASASVNYNSSRVSIAVFGGTK